MFLQLFLQFRSRRGRYIEDAAGAILGAGVFSDSAIAKTLLAFLSSPVGWGVLIFIGSVIVGFQLSDGVTVDV